MSRPSVLFNKTYGLAQQSLNNKSNQRIASDIPLVLKWAILLIEIERHDPFKPKLVSTHDYLFRIYLTEKQVVLLAPCQPISARSAGCLMLSY
jgi:hypothetical protein